MKRAAIAIVALLLFGGARLPLEIDLTKAQAAAGFNSPDLNLPLRQQIGQMGFVAALSGFRSLVAAVLWIEASGSAWEELEWGRMAGLFRTVTTLQPKSIPYWDGAAWHMAWNASVEALDNKKQPSLILRQREQRKYFELGRQFYDDGLKANPNSGDLWQKLGILERDKFQDHSAAAKAFLTAAEKPDARPYYRRMAAYEIAQIPGREREAYDLMKSLYAEGPAQRAPTLIKDLRVLEEKLGVPPDQRIKETP